MRRIDISSTSQCFSRAPIAPVDGHTIRYGLADVQRHGHAAHGCNSDVEPGSSIIGDIHRANSNGAIKRFDGIQRQVPALANKAVMGWECGEFRQRLGFCQAVGVQNCAVIVDKGDIVPFCGWGRCASTASPCLNCGDCRYKPIREYKRIRCAALCSNRIRNGSKACVIYFSVCHQ